MLDQSHRYVELDCIGILSEVYAALTWHQAKPPLDPEQAAEVVRLLVEPPSLDR